MTDTQKKNPGLNVGYCPRCDMCPFYARVIPNTTAGKITLSAIATYTRLCPVCLTPLQDSRQYYATMKVETAPPGAQPEGNL